MSSPPYDPTVAAAPEAVRAWDRWWFDPVRPTTLGIIRICTGLIVLYVHFLYTFQLQEFFGKDAWVDLKSINTVRREAPVPHVSSDWTPTPNIFSPVDPTEAESLKRYADEWGGMDRRLNAFEGSPIWSVWFHITDPGEMAFLHGLILFVMVLFTLGFCTRITSVLTWIGAMCYIQRSQTTLFGMDTMMNVLLIYLMIGPSGGALSLDRWISYWWGRRKARQEGRPAPAWQPSEPSMGARFAMRMIQIHFCIIYMASGLSKLLGSSWWGGTALWYTWANYEFAPFQFQLYQDFLIWLAQHRLLWEMVITGGVVFTLALEIGFPFLVWIPQLRWLMIIGAVLLHTGIAMTMGLTTFGMLMLCMLLAFVPVATVEQLLARIPRPAFLRSTA